MLNTLVKLQIKLGHDVKIVSKYQNKLYEDLPIITVKKSKDFSKIIEEWCPDIILFHGVYFYSYSVYAKMLYKRNIPYIIQLHGALSIYNFNKNRLKKRIAFYLFIKRFLKNAKSILYLSKDEYSRNIVPKINPSFNILPNGCPTVKMNTNIGYENDQVEIVFIGRIDFIGKGLDVLFEGLRKFNKKEQLFHITIYGTGTSKNVTLLKRSLKGLSNIVSYKGELYGREKDEVLRNCDVFLLTSRSEGMPMGVLEALSYGIPCIVTPETNVSSMIVENNAGWVSHLSSQDISETIILAVESIIKDKIKYRENAYGLSKKLSWDVIAFKSIKILEEIINNNK